ncbi:MAG: hypothetical protein HC886_09770, partial [Leptolyngbyaceae cyanobacterium SM1_1_3]|nr:hypothetical protein [Leptolyngbyaceae cyanobacterium SM1_1_3]
TSLYFLRYMAHRYLTAQIEAFLDPLPHDCWPRHYQHFGANMGVSSEIYGRVGGIPNVQNQEDVALYRRLQQVDAKIRHSPHVRVTTSARRTGRTSGGLAERLSQLTQAGRQRRAVLVESPQLTEARILVRNQLRQIWTAINCNACSLTLWSARISLLAESLGLAEAQLQQAIAIAPTFGLLLEAVELEQKQGADTSFWLHATTEISLANMHLRQRLQGLRQQWAASAATLDSLAQPYDLPGNGLETLKQIQPIPLFSLTY